MKSKNLHYPTSLAALVPPIAWAALIFVASSLPGSSYPAPPFFGADKLVHLGIYTVLGGLTARAWLAASKAQLKAAFLAGALLASCYGATDELHQWFVPGRSASLADAATDALGSLLGAAVPALARRGARGV